ncbi:MAG: hypothetical protein JSV45_12780 [Chromatiales bacterium]|nr:MAG: hypothetical protein JSV45_12780 [Chromatiales bacterium]
MQLDREPSAGVFVRSFRPGTLRLADREITSAVILTATEVITSWAPPDVGAMSIDDFALALEHEPELLLLGTGTRQRFPAPEIGVHIMRAGIGFEVMDTRAACRTFNVLAAEGRRVMAALLLD